MRQQRQWLVMWYDGRRDAYLWQTKQTHIFDLLNVRWCNNDNNNNRNDSNSNYFYYYFFFSSNSTTTGVVSGVVRLQTINYTDGFVPASHCCARQLGIVRARPYTAYARTRYVNRGQGVMRCIRYSIHNDIPSDCRHSTERDGKNAYALDRSAHRL